MSRTRRYAVLGTATFVVCLVMFAPAAPLRDAVQQIPGVTLGRPSGSLWIGSAELNYSGQRLGRLSWSYRPQDLLRLRIGYGFNIDGPEQQLQGAGSASTETIEASVSGRLNASVLTNLLGRYDIAIDGEFNVPPSIEIDATWERLTRATGKLRWSGGNVRYTLGATTRSTTLPELIAYLETPATGPSATVYAAGDDTPLLLASVQPDGWVTIGITRRFTELVGQPWSGSQPDHTVIMEVQEKLF